MCGIFGWALGAANRQNGETLARLTNLMAHRGPDGAGYKLLDTAGGRFQIGLGHRRLSIIDIGGGQQPMESADGRYTVVFNGEIYNYIELREELLALGHSFRTSSDTEVLIEAFRAWDLEAIARFRGMFAFALWDKETQRLVLARDAFGKKPLFLAMRPNALVFGSEIEPLVQFPGIDRSFNADALGHYLLNRYVPGPATFFRAVTKLQPGHYAVWKDGSLSITRYFTPPFANTVPDVTSFDEAVRLFETSFDEAVRIRMRSDAPFGAYLSGGIDSSAVVATMVKHSAAPVRTFSVGFRESEYSELDHARVIAEQFGTDHQELVVEPQAFMDDWETAVLRRGAPVSEASDIPIFMLSKLASRSVKMVLTGEGSDELMGGYPKHRAEPWVSLYQRLMPEVLHEQLVSPLVRALALRHAPGEGPCHGCRRARSRQPHAPLVWRHLGQGARGHHGPRGHVDAAGPLSVFAKSFEPAAGSVLRSDLVASRQSAGAWRPHDDGGVDRGPHAVHGCGFGRRRGALPRSLPGRRERRKGRVAGKHGEAPAAQHPATEKSRVPRALRPLGEGTLSRLRPRHARQRRLTLGADLQPGKAQQPAQRARRRLAESRAGSVVADQSRDLPARVQACAG